MNASTIDHCTSTCRALADPTRFRVLCCLTEKEASVGELVEALDIEQSLLSHHLRVLREAGLVEARRDGRQVIYSLAGTFDRRRARLNFDHLTLTFKDAAVS